MKNIFIFSFLIVVSGSFAQVPRSITNQSWFNGWVNSYRQTNTIDASGYLIETLDESYSPTPGAWQPSSQFNYTNNATGQEMQNSYYYWSQSTNAWVLSSVSQSTYNAKSKLTSRLKQSMNLGTLVNNQLENNVYDAKGFLISDETKLWNNGAWKLNRASTYTNNNVGDPLIYQSQTLLSGSMQNDIQVLYTWQSKGNPSEMILKQWTGGLWENSLKAVVVYDIFGFVITEEIYEWVNNKWEMDERYQFTNYPDGKMDYYISEVLNGSTWEKDQKVTYEWFGMAPTGIRELTEELMQPAVYFDLSGNQVEKQKNVILIEQRGNTRRKVIIQD